MPFKNKEDLINNKKKYYLDNKMDILKLRKEYFIKNKEKVAIRDKKRYDCKIEEILKQKKDYYNTHRDIFPNRQRESKLKNKYGINIKKYNKLLEEQKGVCAICNNAKQDNKNFAVDHNHINGKIRGLLCTKCNCALGLLNDDRELLIKALDYLSNGERLL